MDQKQILERIDFNEKRIRKILKELNMLKIAVQDGFSDSDIVVKLIHDEKLRIKIALSMTKSRKETSELLCMTERTLFIKLKEYGFKTKNNIRKSI